MSKLCTTAPEIERLRFNKEHKKDQQAAKRQHTLTFRIWHIWILTQFHQFSSIFCSFPPHPLLTRPTSAVWSFRHHPQQVVQSMFLQ